MTSKESQLQAAENYAETTQNADDRPEDSSEFIEAQENTICGLDDEVIIWRFAQGKKRLVINDNLRIDYAHNSLQLSTPDRDLIAIHKISEKLHYILIEKDSEYAEIIENIISKCQFIPIDTATSDRRFIRYQKYEIPEGYHLHYDTAAELWQTWQDERYALTEQQHSDVTQHLDISILAKGKWYRIQQMVCLDDRLDIQTRLGLISLSLRERIAWVSKIGDIQTIANVDLGSHQSVHNSGSDSDILGKIISKLAIEASPNLDLHSSPVSMSNSAADRAQDSSSLLYNEDRSSSLTGYTISPVSEQMRMNAMNVLENYLEHGETIVRTETVADAQGNIISEKTVTTQRGCPRWAIEAIIQWQ
jgi:hypothetical protein